LLAKLSSATIGFLSTLAAEGADVYQLFDSWAGMLTRPEYLHWAQPFHQEILAKANRIPRIPVFTDSPMAIKAVEIFMKYAGEFNDEAQQLVQQYGSSLNWEGFHFAPKQEDSKKINEVRYPCIIVSSSGMVTGGRILHHLMLRLSDPRNQVIFIGFQAPGTRGEIIKRGAKSVRIYSQEVPIRAHVAALEQFSDHAGAPAAQTPTMRVAGEWAFIHRPTPASSAPFPSGTSAKSKGSGQRDNSMAIVPAPSAMAGSRPSSTKQAVVSSANMRACPLAASKSSPKRRTSDPNSLMRCSLSGFAVSAAKTTSSKPRLRAA
jgi:hypothetical protein